MEIIIAIIALLIGGGISYFVFNKMAEHKGNTIINGARKEAEQIKKEKLLQAKEKFLELKSEHEKIINNKNNEITKVENRIKDKENTLSQKLEKTNKKEKELEIFLLLPIFYYMNPFFPSGNFFNNWYATMGLISLPFYIYLSNNKISGK